MKVLLLWLAPSLAFGDGPTNDVDQILAAFDAGEVVSHIGVSVKSGDFPEYPDGTRDLLLRTSCRVWLRIDKGEGVEVLHEDCPEVMRDGLDRSLESSTWQRTNQPDLNGLLALKVSHTRDRRFPNGVRVAFQPHDLHPTLKQVAPKPIGTDTVRCEALVQVGPAGKPVAIEIPACEERRAGALEKAVRKWRWSPMVIGGEPRPFTIKVAASL